MCPLPPCNAAASWVNQTFSVPTNAPIWVTIAARGTVYFGDSPAWALANISSIEIDPAFLLIDPNAHLVFAPGVDLTGPDTLPTRGQP